MLCADCRENIARVGHTTCYRCHVRSIGFTFKGAAYGKKSWHDQTIAERQNEAMSKPSVEPI